MTDEPPFYVSEWLNSDRPLALADFHGRVLAVEVFQMLCPGCVSHGLPQAGRIAATFDVAQVAVIGLHSVFEHHAAMTVVALKAFLHEYRIHFPVGVDLTADGPMPRTMQAGVLRARRLWCCSTDMAGCGRAISARSRTWPWGLRSWACCKRRVRDRHLECSPEKTARDRSA